MTGKTLAKKKNEKGNGKSLEIFRKVGGWLL